LVNLRAITDQVTGQPLTLECNATTVRGITSSVDISLFSLETVEDVNPIIVGNSAVYSATFTIEELTSFDNGRLLFCDVNINGSFVGFDSLTLDVLGKEMCTKHLHKECYLHIV